MDSLAELTRRLDNLIRLGTIAKVDHAAARCRVKSRTWLPWIALRAGATLDWNPPTEGEQCVLFSPSGETIYRLTVNGRDITADITARLISLTLTANRGPEADTLRWPGRTWSPALSCSGAPECEASTRSPRRAAQRERCAS